MIVFLAIVAVVLVVAVTSLFFWGYDCLGSSLVLFCTGIALFYFTIYGFVDESIELCNGKGSVHCTEFNLANDSGLYWTIMVGHFFVTIFVFAVGFYTFRKAQLNKVCPYKNT